MRNASSRSRAVSASSASDVVRSRVALPAGSLFAVGLVASTVLTSIACGDSEPRACRVGADCTSGVCGEDGRCVDGPAASSGSSGSGDADAASDAGDGGALPPDDGGNLALPGCTPNNDGVITREEVPIQAGLRATFRVAENVDVSTSGSPLPNNRRRWDLSGPLTNDASVLVETLPLTDKWYAPKYTSATYATQLRKSSDLLGVFETNADALRLNGVVSPSDGLTKTQLTNDPPVTMLQFPLSVGVKWTSDTSVSGTAQGFIMAYSEKYDAEVDLAGELVTPLGTFEVLRVRIDLTRTIGFSTTTSKSYAFITECYGNVASIASQDNEKDADFSRAVEVRRIAP